MTSTGRLKRGGPQLPYETLAGIVPCRPGWLVVSAKLQGVTIAPQAPEIFAKFVEVLDYRPAFSAMTIQLPLGLPSSRRRGGRRCDRDARALLKWPRASAIASPPTWQDVRTWHDNPSVRRGLSAVTRSLMPKINEVYEHLGNYHQRTLFEVHPELSFYQLNGDRPLLYSKHVEPGRQERWNLLAAKVPGIERILEAPPARIDIARLLDAAACLWTARRVFARAVTRQPEQAEWDDQGFRMEIVR